MIIQFLKIIILNTVQLCADLLIEKRKYHFDKFSTLKSVHVRRIEQDFLIGNIQVSESSINLIDQLAITQLAITQLAKQV